MLKDYLEIEIDSQAESSDGFPCYPRLADAATVRHLLAAELRGGAGKPFERPRSAKGGALTRISAAIKLKLLPFSAAEGRSGEGFLARSFSKRIRGSFWKKRSEDAEGKGEGEGERDRKRSVRVKDIVRLRSFEEIEERRSFGCPSPVVSSCGSSSESESSSSSGSDFVSSSIGSSEFLDEIESAAAKNSSPPRSPNANANANPNPNPNPRVCTVADIGVRAEGTATGDTKVRFIQLILLSLLITVMLYTKSCPEPDAPRPPWTAPFYLRPSTVEFTRSGVDRTDRVIYQ